MMHTEGSLSMSKRLHTDSCSKNSDIIEDRKYSEAKIDSDTKKSYKTVAKRDTNFTDTSENLTATK